MSSAQQKGGRGRQMGDGAGVARAGFTVIELLVVVAIIALLISILLPSLQAAREQARIAVCSSNLRQAGTGLNAYATEHDSYLPGPNTSGYYQREAILSDVLASNALDELYESSTAPIQHDDWMSPIFGDTFGLPTNRQERMLRLFNHDFRCPSNPWTYGWVYPESEQDNWPTAGSIRYNSYSAPLSLHVYQDPNAAIRGGQPHGFFLENRFARSIDIARARHDFRLETVGNPSDKAFALDGSRYVRRGEVNFNAGQTDYDLFFAQTFMSRGPGMGCFSQNSGSPYKFSDEISTEYDPEPPYPLAEDARYAYRHAGQTLNISFLDGHVKRADNGESRTARYWFPRGTKVLLERLPGYDWGVSDWRVKVGYIVP